MRPGLNDIEMAMARARFEALVSLASDVLAEPPWAELLTPADRRGLTPLFWMHVLPTARSIDMGARLNIGQPAVDLVN